MTPAQKVIRRVYVEERDRQYQAGKVGPEAIVRAQLATAGRLGVSQASVSRVQVTA